MSEHVYIGLGSNLGDRELMLGEAVHALSRIDAVAVLARSSLYESAAILHPSSPEPQPRYLNAVVRIECGLPPQRLLAILKQIEHDLGRRPGPRWAARPIDLDILFWEDRIVADPNLQVPHLELHKRRFVLEPLSELVPDAVHPLLQATVRELLAELHAQDVVKIPSTRWPQA